MGQISISLSSQFWISCYEYHRLNDSAIYQSKQVTAALWSAGNDICAGNLTWNMSQSGTTISPRRRLLKATEAICKVWNVGSLRMKSSDAVAPNQNVVW